MTKIKNIISKRLEKNSEVLPIKHLFTLILLFSLFIIAYLDDFFDIKFIDDLAEIAYRWADDGDKVYVALLHWNLKPWNVWRTLFCIDVLYTWDRYGSILYYERSIDITNPYLLHYCRDMSGNFIPIRLLEDWAVSDNWTAKLKYIKVSVSFSSAILVCIWINSISRVVSHALSNIRIFIIIVRDPKILIK